MNEYEELIQNHVRKQLRSRVKGKLYVAVKDDSLIVHVKNFDMDYEETIDDLSTKVILGHYNSDTFIHEFLVRYRTYVIRKALEKNFD